MKVTQEYIDVDGVTLFIRRQGDPANPTLVVLHGGPSWDHSYLVSPLDELTTTHQVVWVDLRGCGRSSRDLPLSAYDPVLCVRDTFALVKRLGLEQVDLLGFSFGGSLAMRFAAEYPDRLRRLILASACAYDDIDRYRRDWDAYQARLRQYPETDGDPDSDPLSRTQVMAESSAPHHLWNLELLPQWRKVVKQIRFSGDWWRVFDAGLMTSPRPADPAKALRDAGKPTLVLHGEMDLGFPVQLARRLYEEVPGSRLEIIEQAGHMAHFERPDAWLAAVRRFLQP